MAALSPDKLVEKGAVHCKAEPLKRRPHLWHSVHFVEEGHVRRQRPGRPEPPALTVPGGHCGSGRAQEAIALVGAA